MILIGIISMAGIGLILAIVLVVANQKLGVVEDPRIEQIFSFLPGVNCGACGNASCYNFAENIIKQQTNNICPIGGVATAKNIAKVLGTENQEMDHKCAILYCRGGIDKANSKKYIGIKDCLAASLINGGNKFCIYGCLGFGSCAKVCPKKAIKMNNGLPEINSELCSGCGLCVKECPRKIIGLVKKKKMPFVACASLNSGKEVRIHCKIGCIGCGVCVKICPIKNIELKNNLAYIINPEICNDCDKCIVKCPTKAIIFTSSLN